MKDSARLPRRTFRGDTKRGGGNLAKMYGDKTIIQTSFTNALNLSKKP